VKSATISKCQEGKDKLEKGKEGAKNFSEQLNLAPMLALGSLPV